MASVRKETVVDASADEVWDALRDWGALHSRFAPGFAVDTRIDGHDRIVKIFNGAELRERLIDQDDEVRRLVWSIVDGPYTHHNGCAQVFAEEDGRARFVWVSDLLPDEAAGRTRDMMGHACDAIQRNFAGAESASAA